MKKYTVFIAMLLALLCSLGSISVFADSHTQSTPQSTLPNFDYSNGSPSYKTELSPSELLTMLSPETTIGSAERKYLDRYSNISFLIEGSFSNEYISAERSQDKISITAREYSYTSTGGTLVRWIPVAAHYGDSSIPLSESGRYTCEFNYSPEITHISADYVCKITVPAADASFLLNFAYYEACDALALEEEYASVMGEYLEKYREYEEYLDSLEEYEAEREAYENYLALQKEYDDDFKAYTKYLADLIEYNKKLDIYEQYQKDYEKYLAEKANYDKIYAENADSMDEYIAYYEKLNAIRSSMYAIENLFVQTEKTGSIYSALQNKEMVAMFERYKYELKIYGIQPATIDSLSATSDELNDLLRGYNDARNKSEKDAFEYYAKHYEEITYKFNYLYDRMMEIMTPTIFNHVCILMNNEYKNDPEMAEYKKWRITNVLAHIYLVSRCLDDNVSAGGSWDFFDYALNEHKYYFPELLDTSVIISDSNAANPAGLSWPTNPPAFTLPPLPKEPEKVTEPLLPPTVDEPIPPSEVNEPSPPAEVAHPGEAPTGLEGLLKTAEITEAVREGSLAKRDDISTDVELTFKHTLRKLVSPSGLPVLTLYGYNSGEVLAEEIISQSSALPSAAPERPADRANTYSFAGWSSSPDELVEISNEEIRSASSDICAFAYYTSTPREYTVRWVTASGTIEEKYHYKDTPAFKGNIGKEPTNTLVYSFAGWSPEIEPVYEDVTYTAEYSSSERLYTAEWKVYGKTTTTKHSFGDLPTPPIPNKKFIVDQTLYEFLSWDISPASPIKQDTTYSAQYKQTLLVSAEEGDLVLTSSSSAYKLSTTSGTLKLGALLSLASKEGKRVDIAFGNASLTLDKTAVRSLASKGAAEISLTYSISENGFGECDLKISDASGNDVTASGELRIYLPFSAEEPRNYRVFEILSDNIKRDTAYSISEGLLVFSARSSAHYELTRLYSVSFDEVENGGTLLDSYLYFEGDTLSPIFYPAIGYEIESITVTRADNGEKILLDSLKGFVMPNCDITINVKFEKIRYTVTFIVDGEVVSSEKYFIGDMPKPPAVIAEYEKDGYRYVFAGWSPTVSSVTRDTTYYAKYTSVLIDMVSYGQDTGDENAAFVQYTILPLAAIAISFVALIFCLIYAIRTIRRKRKKKKKNKE